MPNSWISAITRGVKPVLWLSILSSCAPSFDQTYPSANRTYLSVSKEHGVQIFFIDYKSNWLWYPGNARVVEGTWRIRGGRQNLICWTPEENTYNPVTNQFGRAEACEILADSASRVKQSLPGDHFNLRSGKIPYRREKCDVPSPFRGLAWGLC